MKFSTKICGAALTASITFPVIAQPKETAKQTTTTAPASSTTGRKLAISKVAEQRILELQAAVNAKDVASIPAKLAAAQAVAKSPDEKFFVASNQTQAALNANDLDAIRAGLDAMLASGAAETPDLVARYTDLGKRFDNAKRVDEAVVELNKALALNPNNVSTLVNLAGIRESQGQKAEAVALIQKSFAASKATGVKVPEGNYRFAASLAYSQRLPVANDIARQWVETYPSPANWRDLLRIYRDLNKPSQEQSIDLLRLGRAANALRGESDYFELGSALVKTGKLAEAKSLLAEAKAAPNVDSSKGPFNEWTESVAEAPTRAAVDASAKAALARGNGKAMIDAGDALYGVGAYAEAVPLYRAALTKGGDASLANLHLGMALARSGDKAGATAALNAVTGVNADVARYWRLWLETAA